jgi:hypothetical protein
VVTVATCTHVTDVWRELSKLYSSQALVCTVNTHIALATIKKHRLSAAEYYGKMRSLADDMASIDMPSLDDELVSSILAGLDEDYNSVYTVVTTRIDPITPSELYAQLLGFEKHLQLQVDNASGLAPLANSSSCRCRMALGHSRGFSHGHGHGRSRGEFYGDSTNARSSTNSNNRPHAKPASRSGTRQPHVGIASMKILFLNSVPRWLRHAPPPPTTIGSLIVVPPTISPVNLTSSLCMMPTPTPIRSML